MRRSSKVIFISALCLCFALMGCVGLAEASQAVIEHETKWAELYGATLDTSKQAQNITKKCKVRVSEGNIKKAWDRLHRWLHEGSVERGLEIIDDTIADMKWDGEFEA